MGVQTWLNKKDCPGKRALSVIEALSLVHIHKLRKISLGMREERNEGRVAACITEGGGVSLYPLAFPFVVRSASLKKPTDTAQGIDFLATGVPVASLTLPGSHRTVCSVQHASCMHTRGGEPTRAGVGRFVRTKVQPPS